ncbi:hypothetical protein [Chroococcidiopsis sp. TS-821]|uniref:hypothetical protein n=1 Tax=Chroococcidiopsis sp. TS-821 TaxID=1378066 RepID=UPI000CEDF70E|nr:hypothetical protein [Chroococcidiopsis sp. TS-821]
MTFIEQDIVLLVYFISILWCVTSYLRTQKALQWWSYGQSLKLADEAERIRNSLLQESCCMRRSIERSIAEKPETFAGHEWIHSVEFLHHSLANLGDRLAPPYVEHSLPLAIEFLIESWQAKNSQLNIKTQLPKLWRDELPSRSVFVLQILDELLRILSVKNLTKYSIEISLIPLQYELNELVVKISYPDAQSLSLCSQSPELKYLRRTFRFLTSGQCFYRKTKLTETLDFRWRSLTRNS